MATMPVDDPLAGVAPVEERAAVDAQTFAAEVATRYQPIVLRGQVAQWGGVQAARNGDRAFPSPRPGPGRRRSMR